jgi:transcriptional regulator with GAF, ATPase, and Fis domain
MTVLATYTSEQLAGSGFVCGQAPSVQALNLMVAEIAKTDIPVLLVGESGTGKEIYARLIHKLINEARRRAESYQLPLLIFPSQCEPKSRNTLESSSARRGR